MSDNGDRKICRLVNPLIMQEMSVVAKAPSANLRQQDFKCIQDRCELWVYDEDGITGRCAFSSIANSLRNWIMSKQE